MKPNCKYCIHYNPHLGNRCDYDKSNKCHLLGKYVYEMFECVPDHTVKEIDKEKAAKEDRCRKQMAQDLIYLTASIIFSLGVITVFILTLIYRFSNPELTETQIAIWTLKKFWWVFVAGLIRSLKRL